MQDELKELLATYLKGEALEFVVGFLVYCNFVDDIVDGKADAEHVIMTFEFSAMLYTSEFYRRHFAVLLPLIKATGNAYADSVKFEGAAEEWKQRYGDMLRQVGNEVLCACVELENGYAAKREFSEKLREISYKTHHNEKGEMV